MSKIEMYNESSQTLSRFVDFCQTQYTHTHEKSNIAIDLQLLPVLSRPQP